MKFYSVGIYTRDEGSESSLFPYKKEAIAHFERLKANARSDQSVSIAVVSLQEGERQFSRQVAYILEDLED